MKAIILAGGPGLGLRPLTNDKPKAMVTVNGSPIAEHQLRWLEKSGLKQVIFSCGYKGERIKEAFGLQYNNTRMEYCVEPEPLGTGGAIKKAIKQFQLRDEENLVLNGDVITDFNIQQMIEWHNVSHPIVTMLIVPFRSPYGVVEIDKLRTIRKFEEKPEFKDVWINGGVYIINPKRIFNYLPDSGDIEQYTFPKLVTYGEIQAHPYYGFWRSIDNIKDLQAAEKEIVTRASSHA